MHHSAVIGAWKRRECRRSKSSRAPCCERKQLFHFPFLEVIPQFSVSAAPSSLLRVCDCEVGRPWDCPANFFHEHVTGDKHWAIHSSIEHDESKQIIVCNMDRAKKAWPSFANLNKELWLVSIFDLNLISLRTLSAWTKRKSTCRCCGILHTFRGKKKIALC